MIQLKPINYTNASSIDVEAIVENLQILADEIESSRDHKNVIPTGIGSFSCAIAHRGTYPVIPKGRLRLGINSAFCTLGDNIKQSVKVSLLINDKKIASIKFAASERSGKLQIFELPDGLELGTFDEMFVRSSDDRRLIVNVNAITRGGLDG